MNMAMSFPMEAEVLPARYTKASKAFGDSTPPMYLHYDQPLARFWRRLHPDDCAQAVAIFGLIQMQIVCRIQTRASAGFVSLRRPNSRASDAAYCSGLALSIFNLETPAPAKTQKRSSSGSPGRTP